VRIALLWCRRSAVGTRLPQAASKPGLFGGRDDTLHGKLRHPD